MILGISAYAHDSAACLVKDGVLLCAFEEERFSRVKHDNAFPEASIRACMRYAGIAADDISCVAYYEKPLLRFERIIDRFVDRYPRGMQKFIAHVPEWLGTKLTPEREIRRVVGALCKIRYVPHHASHAAAAFLPSPFPSAAILTIDGVGEYQTATLAHGDERGIRLLASVPYPNSLGLLYSVFTAFLGFPVNEGEYKMMGLAAYGSPRFRDAINGMLSRFPDGSFAIDERYVSFEGEEGFAWRAPFVEAFGEPRVGGEFSARDKDLAASIQTVTEELYFGLLTRLHELTGESRVCIGGGVAYNSLANGRVSARTPFRDSYIFGASGDSGAAAGAALLVSSERGAPRVPIDDLCLGNAYAAPEVDVALDAAGLSGEHMPRTALIARVAQALAEGAVVALFQDRAEFGPRALGNRSIIADPSFPGAKDRLNRIKGREEFRPVAVSMHPSALHEVLDCDRDAVPFMNYCYPVRAEWRSRIPAAVHADGTCRVHTPHRGFMHELLAERVRRGESPCLINTSFNAHEPIVETPEQAIATFLTSGIDALAIGERWITRQGRAVGHRDSR